MDINQVGFGIGGDQAYQQSQQNDQQLQMNALTIQQKQQEVDQQQQDADIANQAKTIMSNIALGKGGVGAPQSQGNTAASMQDAFLQTGSKLMQLGAPKMAMEYYKNAATIGKNEQDVATSRTKQQESAAETLLKQSDIIAQKLGSATTPEEWNQGVHELAQSGAFQPQQVQMFQNMPFHPATAAHLREASLSVKDKAQLDILQSNQQLRQAQMQSDRDFKATRLAIDQAKLEEDKRYHDLNKKTGAAATAPTSEQVKSVKASIIQNVFNGKAPNDDDVLNAGAFDIASRAQQLVKNNKGLSWQTAVNRAVMDSDQAGDWEVHKGGWFSDDSVKFTGVGKTPDDAMPLPQNPTATDLKKGRWYITAKGRGQWDGQNFNIPE